MHSKCKPKTIDGLMRYLRSAKEIKINGSSQKRKLMNMGYYHGYKGYRYIGIPTNRIPYTNFSEISAIYEFYAQIKALFYPQVMFIETALKNYVLEVMLAQIESDSFSEVYTRLLDGYKEESPVCQQHKDLGEFDKQNKAYKEAIKRRLNLRNRIYKIQTQAYENNNRIAVHYLSRDAGMPIWAIFELLSLGEFGQFVSCLNYTCREAISKKLGIRQSDDTNAKMLQRIIFAIRDFRNAIAHNDVVFDVRFKNSNIGKQLSSTLKSELGIENITFKTITDYLILIVYLLMLFRLPKPDIKKLISNYEDTVEKLRNNIPTSIFHQIVHTDSSNKIKLLNKALKVR